MPQTGNLLTWLVSFHDGRSLCVVHGFSGSPNEFLLPWPSPGLGAWPTSLHHLHVWTWFSPYCLVAWMSSNRLLLNPSKYIWMDTGQLLAKLYLSAASFSHNYCLLSYRSRYGSHTGAEACILLLLASVACRGSWMPGANEVFGCQPSLKNFFQLIHLNQFISENFWRPFC